jgi:hypothetical protein
MSDDCNREWQRGYEDGWAEMKSTKPSIPPLLGSSPPGVDPIQCFYNEGGRLGRREAVQVATGSRDCNPSRVSLNGLSDEHLLAALCGMSHFHFARRRMSGRSQGIWSA